MNKNLEERVTAIEERNKRVEADKAWETSFLRKNINYSTNLCICSTIFKDC